MRFITLSLLLVCSLSFFTNNNTCVAQDKDAQKILDKVSQKFQSLKALQADFSLQIENAAAGINEVQEGKVFVKGEKYKIETADLFRLSDNRYVWTYFIEEEEIQVNDFDPEEGEMSPARLFSIYNEDFNFMINDEKKAATAIVIDLTPKEKSEMPYYKVRLSINTKTDLIEKAVIFEKSGSRFTYVLENVNTKVSFEDSFFELKESDYDDIDWIDLTD
ncbi:MAG: LolA family protein [Chitinophagales bacterium]